MELNERILHYLDKQDKVDTLKLASEFNEDHQKIVGAVKSLEALEMVVSDTVKNTKWELTEEGQLVAEKGSHEAVLYHSVPDGGIAQAEIMKVSFCAYFDKKKLLITMTRWRKLTLLARIIYINVIINITLSEDT